ncbi:MAG: peptidylprolyl isomerase [Bacteroidaceae bacterium]|nr:peptidylprolyl isomerase [Bacteroidaceae bacterium]
MKRIMLAAAVVLTALSAMAQADDPIVMTVNGVDVPRSEFEYSYNKNNTEAVLDRKSLDEYVELFINYKLKVAAAAEERMDTAAAFQKEMADYRAQQAEAYLVDSTYIEEQAREVYRQTAERIGDDGLVLVSHILLRVPQDATAEAQAAAKVRADSIYNALKGGADFAELAGRLSQDPGTARQGGQLPWIQKGQTIPEFERVAFALQPGEMAEPVLSAVGYHIIKMNERKQFEPYEFHRKSIYDWLNQRGITAAAKQSMGKKLAAQMGGDLTPDEALARAEKELDDKYPEFRYLMKEFHDGSMLYEISNREVWDKAAKDEKGLEKFFKKHKKQYAYDEPVFRGIIVNCTTPDVLQQVKKSVKGQPEAQRVQTIREQFNNDSTMQVKIIRGPFKAGKNKYADYYIFKTTKEQPEAIEGFPEVGVIGKLQKKGPDTYEDVRGAVTTDYQNQLEKEWVKVLRSKYTWTVYPDVLDTVNRHN